MNGPPNSLNPMAEAFQWVARIMTVSLEMVLPGLAGRWLDGRLGTSFLVFLGFAFGLTAGVYHLLVMTGAVGQQRKRNNGPPQSNGHQEEED